VKDAARDAKDNAAAQHKCNQKAGGGRCEVIVAEDRNMI